MKAIPPEIEAQCTTEMDIDETIRVCHIMDKNDDICSLYKNKAAVITRTNLGWMWYCHRCGESGFKSAITTSQKDTVEEIKNKAKKIMKEMAVCKLPNDVNSVTENKNAIPAQRWLWKYDINSGYILKYDICWSNIYNRIIFPIFVKDKLIAWIGRDPVERTKEERIEKKIPKYIIRKDLSYDRVYFTCKADSKVVILVEDILSAIKVHEATGFRTIALLTTSIDNDLTRTLRGLTIKVWLDADALSKSVKMVSRFNQLGINAKYIYTIKDPKEYTTDEIKEIIK